MVSKGGDIKAWVAANGQNLIWQHMAKPETPGFGGAAMRQRIV
jgi:hypothetical protein